MKNYILLGAISAVIFATGCTKRIDLDLNNTEFKRLVVEGFITDQNKAHKVRLSWTSSYFENQAAPVASGATVTISDGTNTYALTEQPSGSGLYYTEPTVAGTVGNTYTLAIALNGETWEASDLMRPVAVVDSIALEYVGEDPGQQGPPDANFEPYYAVLLWTTETPGLGDHYRWNTLVNGLSLRDTLSNTSFSDDALVDGSPILGVEIDGVDSSQVESGDVITLEQWSITKTAYDVILAVLTETEYRGGLFDAPPANVPSNISNGGLGFFGAASVSEKSAVVP